MENKFENEISKLNDKEKNFFLKLKDLVFNLYNNFLKNILIAIFLFWFFTKLKKVVGLQEIIFIQLVVIILLLRIIASKLH